MADPQVRLPFQLQSIYVRESHCKIRADFNPLIPGQALSAQMLQIPEPGQALLTQDEKGNVVSLTLIAHFEFRYTDKPVNPARDEPLSESDTCALISADIAAVYALTGPRPTDEEMAAWFRASTILHVWPYWREHCHSTLTRMQLPVTLLPLLELRHVRPELDGAATPSIEPEEANKAANKKRVRRPAKKVEK